MITAILVLLASAFGAVASVYLGHTLPGPKLTQTDYGLLFLGGALFGFVVTPLVLLHLLIRGVGGWVQRVVNRMEGL